MTRITRPPEPSVESEQDSVTALPAGSGKTRRIRKVSAINPDKFRFVQEKRKRFSKGNKGYALLAELLRTAINNATSSNDTTPSSISADSANNNSSQAQQNPQAMNNDDSASEEEKNFAAQPAATTDNARPAGSNLAEKSTSTEQAALLMPMLAEKQLHSLLPSKATNTRTQQLQDLVNRLTSRMLVSLPDPKMQEQVWMTISSGPLQGTQIRVLRHKGELQFSFMAKDMETSSLLASLNEDIATSLKKKLPNERINIQIPSGRKDSSEGHL